MKITLLSTNFNNLIISYCKDICRKTEEIVVLVTVITRRYTIL